MSGPPCAGRTMKGYTLAELLVALLLMGMVLGIATFVEFNLLRRIRKETAEMPTVDCVLALRQLGRDIRSATDAVPAASLPSVPGARLLLVARSPVGKDTLTVYRLEEGKILRSQFLEDGTVLSEDRILARNLEAMEITLDSTQRGVGVTLAQLRGGVFRSFFAIRAHPSVLPPARNFGPESEPGTGPPSDFQDPSR